MDLDDLHHDTEDGLHMASLAGGWIGLVCGFGGLRDHGGRLRLSPRLPTGLSRLSFRLRWRGHLIRVDIEPARATYTLLDLDGEDTSPGAVDPSRIELLHHDQPLSLSAGRPVRLDLPPVVPAGEPPHQPTGRQPRPAST
jgi:alpha,alpha-trehalose phosphorylase